MCVSGCAECHRTECRTNEKGQCERLKYRWWKLNPCKYIREIPVVAKHIFDNCSNLLRTWGKEEENRQHSRFRYISITHTTRLLNGFEKLAFANVFVPRVRTLVCRNSIRRLNSIIRDCFCYGAFSRIATMLMPTILWPAFGNEEFAKIDFTELVD